MSHLPFAYDWQNRLWDSKPVVARFLRKTGGNSNIRIPHNSSELHPTLCMRDMCRVHGLDPSRTLNQIFLSLIFLISLVKHMNQKRGICRHRILYPLQLELLFPNDSEILRPNVGLGLNQILN